MNFLIFALEFWSVVITGVLAGAGILWLMAIWEERNDD